MIPIRWSTFVLGILVLTAWIWAAGVLGIPCGIYLLALMVSLQLAVRREVPGAWTSFLILLGIGLGVLLLLPAISAAREVARRCQCRNNMKQIGFALNEYHERWSCLPPPYLLDAAGRPAHSWRVLLLPHMEADRLYKQYDFDEPWDGPRNSKLLESRPYELACLSGWDKQTQFRKDFTSYVAVVGPKTAWDEDQRAKPLEGHRARAKRVLVVEAADSAVPWTAPVDLSLEKALAGINPKSGGGVASRHDGAFPGAHVAFTDGSVESLPDELPLDLWAALLTGEDDGTAGERLDEFLRQDAERRARAERFPWLVLAALTVAFLAHGLIFGVLLPSLENDPRFLRRVLKARESIRAGRGVRLEDIES